MPSDLKLIPNDFEASKKAFLVKKEKLQKILSDFTVQIEHVGSTSIPGTIGKGIIDVLLICSSTLDQDLIKNRLVQSGFVQGELNKIPDGRLFFVDVSRKTEAGDLHLHVVIKGSNNLQSLAFKNYLLAHAEIIEQYNQEKKKLAKLTHNNRHDYTAKKAKFIEAVMNEINTDNDEQILPRYL